MRATAVWFSLAVAASLPLAAQTASSSSSDLTAPALVSNLTVTSGDSSLVQAAKRTVLYRRSLYAKGPVWHIDDSMVGHRLTHDDAKGERTAASGNSGGSFYVRGSGSASTINTAQGPSPAALKQEAARLKNEMARMTEESDQPYAGEVSEDQVVQTLSTTQTQIDANARQQNQAAPPPPPRD